MTEETTTNSNKNDNVEGEQDAVSPPRARTTSSPSVFSPVGVAGGYSVATDDDDDDDGMNMNDFGNLSPVQMVSESHHHDHHGDEEWQQQQHFNDEDDDLADLSPRIRLESDLQTPLMGGSNNPNNRRNQATKLNGLNYLNVLTYLVHVFVSYGIGVWGLGGYLPTRWDISKQYQTLISPAEYTYYLWAPILLSEFIFVTAQLLPKYRSRPIIQQGTGYFFFYTCLIQIGWTLFYAFQLFVFSFVAVVAALLSLACLLMNQQLCQVRGRKSLMEYWMFRFPFYLHAGFLILCSVVQFSLLFRELTSNPGVQLAADIVSLGVMLPAATFFLTGQPSGPDFIVPLVIVWSYIGIAIPLHNPDPELVEIFQVRSLIEVK